MNENNNPGETPAIRIEADKNNADFQKFATDPNPIYNFFLVSICGYKVEIQRSTRTQLGVTETLETMVIQKPPITKIKTTDKDGKLIETEIVPPTRYANEECASHLFGTIYPSISTLTQTSTLEYNYIYAMWTGLLTSIRKDLLWSQYVDGNPFQIRPHRVPAIMSVIIQMASITMKAKSGYTLDKLVGTFITTTLRKAAADANNTGRSALDRLIHI
jgi:hypothetical protein